MIILSRRKKLICFSQFYVFFFISNKMLVFYNNGIPHLKCVSLLSFFLFLQQCYMMENQIPGLKCAPDVFVTFEGDNVVMLKVRLWKCLFLNSINFRIESYPEIRSVSSDVILQLARIFLPGIYILQQLNRDYIFLLADL